MYALQDSSSSYAKEPVLLNNRQALEQLQQEQEHLTRSCYGVGAALAAGFAINPLLAFCSLPPLGTVVTQLQKTSQIYLNMGRLLEAFEDNSVIITPRLSVPDNGSLDLFVRFPNPPKAVFTIGLRSNGESTIFFNEQKESLCLRRKRGGFKAWQVDLFRRFALQEFWLRKNRQDLFGQSSRDKNRPAVKLLVLTGKTKLGKHAEHLYAKIGEQKVLSVRNRVSLFVMEEEQLIPFIQAWLAKADNPNNG